MVPLATIPRQAVIFIFSLTGNFCNALLGRVSDDKPLSGDLSGEPKADLGGLSVNGRKFRDAAFAIHRTPIDYYFPLIAYYGTQFGQQSPLPDPIANEFVRHLRSKGATLQMPQILSDSHESERRVAPLC
jgi:hypothetical protein